MGWQAVEGGAVGVKNIRPLLGDLGERAFFLLGLANGAVVDVRQVADVPHLVRAELELEQAAQDIVHDERAEIADMGRSIDGRSAVIEAEDAIRLRGLEFAHAAGK